MIWTSDQAGLSVCLLAWLEQYLHSQYSCPSVSLSAFQMLAICICLSVCLSVCPLAVKRDESNILHYHTYWSHRVWVYLWHVFYQQMTLTCIKPCLNNVHNSSSIEQSTLVIFSCFLSSCRLPLLKHLLGTCAQAFNLLAKVLSFTFIWLKAVENKIQFSYVIPCSGAGRQDYK